MIVFFVIVAFLLVGVVLATWKKGESVLGIVMSIIGLFALVYSLVAIITNCTNVDAQVKALECKKQALEYQLDRDMYVGTYNAVGDFNAEVTLNKIGLSNPWVNWYYSPAYEQIDMIELK